jgi:phosphoserine phosphatase
MSLSYALVLTAAPGSAAITDDLVRDIAARLSISDSRWLTPQRDAWEAAVATDGSTGAAGLSNIAREVAGERPIDVNAIPMAQRRKRLLAADMESTIIEQELIDEMASIAGCHAEISAITAAAMRGEIDFEVSLARRVALFAGLEVSRLIPLLDRVTPMPGAETLVNAMRAQGATTALISGGFTVFAEPIGARLGFDAVVANVLEIASGKLTGRVQQPIVGPQGKADALARLAAARGVDLAETIAVGDGANDVAMLAAAGLGVAFRAKPLLVRHARTLDGGAVVTHGDLTALLHLQGVTLPGSRRLGDNGV